MGRAEQHHQRRVLIHRGLDRAPPPGEHARIPGGAGDVHQLARASLARLLLEGEQRIGREPIDPLAAHRVRPKIPVVGRRKGRLDAERDERVVNPERAGRQAFGRRRQDAGEDVLASPELPRDPDLLHHELYRYYGALASLRKVLDDRDACIELAAAHSIRSIAFPSISTGAYGFPMERAAPIAVGAVRGALAENTGLELVRFVCYGREAYELYSALLAAN